MLDPTFFNTVWSLLGQICVILVAGACIVFLERMRQKAMEWYNERKLHPIARSVLGNKQVNALLIELRTKTDSERASVFLFHNGQVFSNKNPLWRVSCTQECCRSGISHEIANLQNMLASLYWDVLAALFGTGQDCGAGIVEHGNAAKRIYQIDVHKLDDNFYKRSMIARGVTTAFVSPIIDGRKEIVGYLSLEYCGESPPPKAEDVLPTLVEYAGSIHFALTAP